MAIPDAVAAVVREWLAKADNNLKNAAHTLTMGQDAPTDTICFHAQQCVEKYLKALLVLRSIPFARTHDIRALRMLLPARLRPRRGAIKNPIALARDGVRPLAGLPRR
jgi:HEPN domain-containing protein